MEHRFFSPPLELPASSDTPLVFLAGPIQGAQDWQKEVAEKVLTLRDDLAVASPRSYGERLPYSEQAHWEVKHLRRSAELGLVAFWFASKDSLVPYEEGRAYAQTSRIEIGRIFGWHDHTPFPIVVGIDQEYTKNGGGSQRYIEFMCAEKNIPVANNLEDFIGAITTETPPTRG